MAQIRNDGKHRETCFDQLTPFCIPIIANPSFSRVIFLLSTFLSLDHFVCIWVAHFDFLPNSPLFFFLKLEYRRWYSI